MRENVTNRKCYFLSRICIIDSAKNAVLWSKRTKGATIWLVDVNTNFATFVALNGLLLTTESTIKMVIWCRLLKEDRPMSTMAVKIVATIAVRETAVAATAIVTMTTAAVVWMTVAVDLSSKESSKFYFSFYSYLPCCSFFWPEMFLFGSQCSWHQ